MRTKWFSARALRLHLTLVIVAGGCIALGWWQLSRALSGNGLSWVYTVEWPFFAVYASYLWWKFIHEDDDAAVLDASERPQDAGATGVGLAAAGGIGGASVAAGVAQETVPLGTGRSRRRHRQPVAPPVSGPTELNGFDPYDDDADPELAAYNRYLAGLHEADGARRSRR